MKPIGAFHVDHAPPWITFGHVLSTQGDEDLIAARERSERTGFVWVLYLGYGHPIAEPIGAHAASVKARFERLGLWRHIVAVCYGEEWYLLHLSGALAAYGFPGRTDADIVRGVPVVRDYLGWQHRQIKAAMGKPVVLIEPLINDSLLWGPWNWRPVPPHTDILAIDAYVPSLSAYHGGPGTFALDVDPVLQHAVTTTTQPIVIIPQWFRVEGDPLWGTGPSQEAIEGYARWYRHPRVIALWGFLWASRWSGFVGLSDMPEMRLAIEQSLGVAPP